jgi:hypothetical protein
MIRKWFSIIVLIGIAVALLSVANCGDPQELVSITVQPGTENFGASNVPVGADAGLTVQLRALGNYLHPPVQKDITNQVTWASDDTQMVVVNFNNTPGLAEATGEVCGGTLISATVQTNSDNSGLSSSGAVVTGYMTANVICFTGSGTGSGEPVLTVNFQGSGTGAVTSNSGFSCTSADVSCIDSFPVNTIVTLTATPISPSTFGGWSGACTGTGSCVVDITGNLTVTATFNN